MQPHALGIGDSGKQSTASERVDRAQRFSDVGRVLVLNAHTDLPNDPQACAGYIALPVTNAVRQFVRPCCTRCTWAGRRMYGVTSNALLPINEVKDKAQLRAR